MKKAPIYYWIMIAFFLACDTLEEDVVPIDELALSSSSDELLTTYTSTGEEVLIDVLQGIQASENISITLDRAPTKGEAELLNTGMLRYVPYPDFTTGKDWLVVVLSNRQSTRRDTIEIIMTTPPDTVIDDSINHCTVRLENDRMILIEDIATDQGTYYLDVLANDQLCDQPYRLLLPEDNPSLTVLDSIIAYHSPDQQAISFSYGVCLTAYDTCYQGSVDIRFSDICVPRAVFDSVLIDQAPVGADTIRIDVRKNDQVCDDTPINIYQPPSRGDAWVEDNLILYSYTVDPGDNYGTELKYQYGTVPLADSVNRALVSIEVRSK